MTYFDRGAPLQPFEMDLGGPTLIFSSFDHPRARRAASRRPDRVMEQFARQKMLCRKRVACRIRYPCRLPMMMRG